MPSLGVVDCVRARGGAVDAVMLGAVWRRRVRVHPGSASPPHAIALSLSLCDVAGRRHGGHPGCVAGSNAPGRSHTPLTTTPTETAVSLRRVAAAAAAAAAAGGQDREEARVTAAVGLGAIHPVGRSACTPLPSRPAATNDVLVLVLFACAA